MPQVIHTGTAIVGGGAAGLFAGCFLKDAGADFLVLEKNAECGHKLLLTGHGRCNITNLKAPSELKTGYHEAANFVYPAISSFTPSDAVDYLEKTLGVPTKEEENDRIFPVSDKASDVRDALVSHIGSDHILSGFDCGSIERGSDMFELRSSSGDVIRATNVILACGGMSYPGTGSDGSGFRLAESLGHTIATPVAALSQIRTEEAFCKSLSGVSVDGVILSLYEGGKMKSRITGTVLFTHQGISGPAPMEISREIPKDPGQDTYIEADLVPSLTDKMLAGEINSNASRKFVNLLSDYMPKSLAEAVTGDDELYCRNVTAEIRKKVVKSIKSFRFNITTAPDPALSYCTRGGVILNELDRRTYGSRIVPNLYVIGENTDVDGISGGYNLAFAAGSACLAVRAVLS